MTHFEQELEIFRTEEETAQQYFFAYLGVRSLAAADKDILRAMNATPLFWITVHHAMLLSAFIALGRIFDQESKHNIDSLMSAVQRDLPSFAKPALTARKTTAGLTATEAAQYAADAHEMSAADVRQLRKQIAAWRRVYADRYREVRHKVFAHKALSNVEEVNELLAKTNVDEMKALFGFLTALESALHEAFNNGRAPVLNTRKFDLSSDQSRRTTLPGETIHREAQVMLKALLRANQRG